MADTKTFTFQTEVKSLLNLMIHSLYSNRDIFLRELISNASDACDKLRFMSVGDNALLEADTELKITVDFDAKAKTITVRDNGIGMSYDEVMENLGTIAKSGTKAFLEALSKDQSRDAHLIGQFGVGFYSAFMVADEVTVLTRKAGLAAAEGVRWTSRGEGEFSIDTEARDVRGTEIILRIREDAKEYLSHWRLQQIIHQYSDHVLFPVLLREEDEKEIKFKQVNSGSALWTRSKSEITPEQYQEFYRHVSHDFQDALDWLHIQVEGKQSYTALLYIPKMRDQNLLMSQSQNETGLKLFIERVFIMNHAELLPNYLRFIKGMVDSSDLPLNISREILQINPMTQKIKSGLTKKVLQFLEKMAGQDQDKYLAFWQQFGVILKEGFGEDYEHQKELAELLRLRSTQSERETSLKEYVARMSEGQAGIYYIIADQLAMAENSPHLEIFKKKGFEVLLLTDRVDEWMMSHLAEFEGKKFISVTKGEIKLEETAEDKNLEEEKNSQFKSLIDELQKILAEKVQKVCLSKRLTDSPACLISEEVGFSLHLQRMMQEAGQAIPAIKPIMEINATHPLLIKLLNEQDEDKIKEWAYFLYDQALLSEGAGLENPALFVKRMNRFILEQK